MHIRFAMGPILVGLCLIPLAAAPASASIATMTQSAVTAEDDLIVQVARRGGGGHAHVNRSAKINRGNINRGSVNRANFNRSVNVNRNINRSVHVNRNINVNRGVYRGRHVYHGGGWARPRNYWWPVGGAIAAGAAIGMITAASAASLAGPPPGPGYCWYYTDPSQTQGFWDMCP